MILEDVMKNILCYQTKKMILKI